MVRSERARNIDLPGTVGRLKGRREEGGGRVRRDEDPDLRVPSESEGGSQNLRARCPKTAQEASKTPKMVSKMASKTAQMAPDMTPSGENPMAPPRSRVP